MLMRVSFLLWTVVSAISPFVSGQSSQTQGAQQPHYQAGWPCTGKERSFDPAFARATEATGGHLLLLDRSEAKVSATLALDDSRHKATIVRASGETNSYVDIPFWVDSSVESLFVVASLQCMQTVFLYDPQRSGVDAKIPGVEDTWFRAGRISTVQAPRAGSWTVRLSGKGSYSVAVQANSKASLGGVDLKGNALSIWLNESIADPVFRLVDAAGSPIQALSLSRDPDSPAHYAGRLDLPAINFRVQAEWRGPNSEIVWRTDPRLMEPPPPVVGPRK